MFLEIFRKFLVLYFYLQIASFGQVAENAPVIELGQINFPIERPFTISITIPNSESRPAITFPDIVGFAKKGIVTSVAGTETGNKKANSQVITQSYKAQTSGRFRLPPFSLVIHGQTIHSEGALLLVRPSATNTASGNATLNLVAVAPAGAAFLSVRASKRAIYMGESVALTLSLFVADNYPYELNFMALDKQLQTILKKIRPVNSWEESLPINELKPIPVVLENKKFREYRLYQSVFFPLSNQALHIPAVSLQLIRPRPVIGPPLAQAEKALFTSKPFTINIKPLPIHALRGRVPVGLFRLEERLEQPRVGTGQSVRYTFSVFGEGNIATLPAPTMSYERSEMDVFPPEERHTLSHTGNQVTGHKSFTYFIVPHQNGLVSLANCFQWIYFDPQTARYDTLRPRQQLQVGGQSLITATARSAPVDGVGTRDAATGETATSHSIYAGIEAMDSSRQSISIPTLVRAVANVLIVIMLLGMIFVFFKK